VNRLNREIRELRERVIGCVWAVYGLRRHRRRFVLRHQSPAAESQSGVDAAALKNAPREAKAA